MLFAMASMARRKVELACIKCLVFEALGEVNLDAFNI
jgi:hypothetical protein